mgnify:FL=1
MKTIALKKGEAALITDRLTRKYLAGFDLAEGILILGEKPAYFTDARYFYAAKDKIAPAGAEPILYTGTDVLKNYVEKNGIKTLYIDYDRTTVSECERYKTFGAEIKNCSEELMQLRMIKSEEELACVKKACEIIQEAYHNEIKLAKTGVTEKEIADKIRSEIIRLGGEGESFETIVAFGANAAVPHHETGETRLTENTAILVDTGALFNGYCSDLTRMAFFGTPDEEFKNAYDAVLTANLTAFDKIVGGMSGKDADAIAREVLKQRGYGEYFTHSLGHGVGLEIHERPNVSPRSRDNLDENSVFTVEPGVYLNGKFGIRIEDTATIKNGKAERLFTDSKELFVIK